MNAQRYIRQSNLPELGKDGQRKLAAARVLVAGAGGLGSVLLYSLCAAGVGHITVADGDTVALSNLNRQFLFAEADIGKSKAECAGKRLRELNSDIEVTAINAFLTEANAEALTKGFDTVISAVDSTHARAALNRACCKSGTPLINGGVDGMHGTHSIVIPGKTACLECIGLPKDSPQGQSAFAPVVSVISAFMAQSALLLLLGKTPTYSGELIWFDGRTLETEHIKTERRAGCSVCGDCET